jgi:hypothetical protein
VEESHHPTPNATTTITPRRKATSREDIGKRGVYFTDFTYGLTTALNGKLWPPLKITLPGNIVPGVADRVLLTVAVHWTWAPTLMTVLSLAEGPLWTVHVGGHEVGCPATSKLLSFTSTGPGLTNISVSWGEVPDAPVISAETTFSLGWPPVVATNVVYRYQPTATAIISTIATIIAISRLVIPFTLAGISGWTPLFKYFVVSPT